MASIPPLPAERLHLPYDAGPWRMAMGLTAADPTDLCELDETYPTQMAERWRLLDTRRDAVLAALPGSEAAGAELLALIAELLPRRYPDFFTRTGQRLDNRLTGETWDLAAAHQPLELLGRLVAEDFCLVRPTADGALLIAAVLCFPSRWVLAEKLGRPLLEVHERVPGYAARLGAPVDRFFANLKPGRMALRLNWTIIDDPALFQLTGKFRSAPDPTVTPDTALDKLYLRVERQTFIALPHSGTVSFGIRTHVTPLARIITGAGEAARLAAAVRGLPPEMAIYKSLGRFREPLLAALDRQQ